MPPLALMKELLPDWVRGLVRSSGAVAERQPKHTTAQEERRAPSRKDSPFRFHAPDVCSRRGGSLIHILVSLAHRHLI